MKFTKEDAVKELTAKYASKVEKIDKWKRTIEESVDHAIKMIGESSEIELSQFVDFVVPFLDTTAGFIRKENSDLAKDFNGQIETLKNEVEELKKGKGGKKETDDKGGNDDNTAELLRRIEELENENKQSKSEKTISEKKAEIKSMLKEKGVKRSDWIDLMLSESTISEDTDTEAKATSLLTMYNKMYANIDIETPLETGESSEREKKAVNDVVSAAAEIAKQRIV
jgi:hypothetical protein